MWQLKCETKGRLVRSHIFRKLLQGHTDFFRWRKKVNGMNHMRFLFVSSARILQFRCSAFIFHTDVGNNLNQFEILQFCIKMGSGFVEKAFLYVKVRELKFWYLLLIVDMFRGSIDCQCNESVLFFRCAFCRLW